MSARERYEAWLKNPRIDSKTKEELKAIADAPDEIEERFYKDLEFGTAGLRGILGAGTNRLNIYTVRRATQGLANYILKQGRENPAVAIAFDSRRMSLEFANEAAKCLAANGIKAYRFDTLRPTPELSFAVRYLNCIAGINITASHNPPEYNGYKVYWEDGAQITPPHDKGIMEDVLAITDYTDAKTMSSKDAKAAGLYEIIGKEVDNAYMDAVKSQIRRPEAIAAKNEEIRIVYTPLHGTGNVPIQKILKDLGFKNVYVVPEQEQPDGEFPTVSYPNPEAAEAFELALKLAKEVDAHVVMATDPDADRLGVYVRDKAGEYHCLTGNMSGCLLADYELSQIQDTIGIPDDGFVVKTIVTTNMIDSIARRFDVELRETLTGFKYIGQQILKSEESGHGRYLFGFEESYGCLIGTHARDKDAVMAVVALAEAACYYATQGKNLWDAMIDVYKKYGYYLDDVTSITLSGIEGAEKIKTIMETLRTEPPKELAGLKVEALRDYDRDVVTRFADEAEEEKAEEAGEADGDAPETNAGEAAAEDGIERTGLPKSNVIYLELADDAWVCVRPSGTEPKIKFYLGVVGETMGDATLKKEQLKASVSEMVDKIVG